MQPRALIPPAGYTPEATAVRTLAAQLDPLLRAVAGRVRDAGVAELEWQPHPGTNTIGMLMIHLAVSETFWMQAAVRGIDSHHEVDQIVRATLGIGIDDDGMPLAAAGGHPPRLAGWTAATYLELLERTRRATHATLAGWHDSQIDQVVTIDGSPLTCGWILFHIVEHFAQHAGQISLLASLRRRAQGAVRGGRGGAGPARVTG